MPIVSQTEDEKNNFNKVRTPSAAKKLEDKQAKAKVETLLEEQFQSGRLLGEQSSLLVHIIMDFLINDFNVL